MDIHFQVSEVTDVFLRMDKGPKLTAQFMHIR